MRKFKTLADMAQDPKNWVKLAHPGDLPQRMREYKVLCLDDEVTVQACHLHHSKPRQIIEMLQVVEPPWPHMWVEMDANTLLGTRAELAKIHGGSYSYEKRPDNARVALRIDHHGDYLTVFVLETPLEGKAVFEWPIGFDVAIGDHRFDRVRKSGIVDDHGPMMQVRGRMSATEQSAVVWGYMPDVKGLASLNNRARVHSLPQYAHALDPGIVRSCCEELGGTTRLVVSILAMLNTVLVVEPATRPKERFLSRSGSKAYIERSVTYLNIGARIRNRTEYVRRSITDEVSRRCEHEVRAHWRYLRRKPSVPGWEQVEQNGETYWRKRIAAHKRGDPALGTTRGNVTVVTGRNPLFDTNGD